MRILPLISILLTLNWIGCITEKKGNIQGKISGMSNEPIYLELLTTKTSTIIDSTFCDKNGKFHLNAPKDSLTFLELIIGNDKERIRLIMDVNDQIELMAQKDSILSSYTISGSPNSIVLKKLNKEIYKQRLIEKEISDEFKNAKAVGAEKATFSELNNRYTLATIKHHKFLKSFAQDNPNELSSIIALTAFDPVEEQELFKSVAKGLKSKYQNGYVTHFNNIVEREMHLLNQNAPEIDLMDWKGDTKPLSKSLGKYTLLEFWATWSGTYIQEIHYQKALYKKYQTAGFEIYSVNLDEQTQNWKNTIENLNLKWHCVNDSTGMNTKYKELYQLEKLPTTFLLDSNGVVINKFIRGRKLEKKLIDLFGY